MCKFIAELANLPLRSDQPFVGKSAFAHKGGVHVSAVLKDSATYEHIVPELVGNHQRVLVSDLSGRGNIIYKLKQHGLADRLDEAARRELLERIKQMEYEGYELEAAEGTFELLVREALQPGMHFFDVDRYEVTTRSTAPGVSETTATVILRGRDGVHAATATGHGPFNALHVCLRKCLSQLYPQIAEVRLTDYKVRVLDSNKGTAAKVRVLIEWSDHRTSWSTVGVSDNVIEASWRALVDAIRLELMRSRRRAAGGTQRRRLRGLSLQASRRRRSTVQAASTAINRSNSSACAGLTATRASAIEKNATRSISGTTIRCPDRTGHSTVVSMLTSAAGSQSPSKAHACDDLSAALGDLAERQVGPARLEAGLFLKLAEGRVERRLAVVDAALRRSSRRPRRGPSRTVRPGAPGAPRCRSVHGGGTSADDRVQLLFRSRARRCIKYRRKRSCWTRSAIAV